MEPAQTYYHHYNLTSPIPLVKLMMQQSGCFKVVNRSNTASSALEKERALAGGGEFQKESQMGKGQMVAADYIIIPSIVNKDGNASGGNVNAGGLLGSLGAIVGGVGFKKMEAQVMLTVTNVRTGVDEAIAEGNASKTDIGVSGGAFTRGLVGGGGAYSNTDIGKVVTAAFMDAHNKLSVQLGAIPVNSAKPEHEKAGYETAADLNFRSGPNSSAPVLMRLAKGAPVKPTGATKGDWWEVEANGKTGWVHSDYLTR
jgi:curli biogenesis system outer membrane secretion channel CsgG